MKKILSLILCAVLLLSQTLVFSSCKKDDTVKVSMKISIPNGITGTVKLELDRNAAPITVDNFVKLAKSGFYDGLTFHRILQNFMVQGGDPSANGTGGSDQTIKGEFAVNGYDNPISHKRGVISMARNSRSYDSASSQFFICVADASASLDGQYAAFGNVTSGMEWLDAMVSYAYNGSISKDTNGTLLIKNQQPAIVKVTVE